MDPLNDLLAQVDNLPTLPDVHVRIAETLANPECDLRRVAEMMALDPVLAGRLISMANSALFGSAMRTDSLVDAILRLGAHETRNLVITAAVLQVFDPHGAKVNLRDFWTLGLASALSARQIARDLRFAGTEQAYLAGLVHDLGEAILAVYFPERFTKAMNEAKGEGCDLVQAIWSEFGFTQAVLSCQVLERWNFPPSLIEAVEYHLDPDEAPNEKVLASIVLAGDRICRELGFVGFDPGDDERTWLAEIPREFIRLLLDAGYPDLDTYVTEQKEHLAEVSALVTSVFHS